MSLIPRQYNPANVVLLLGGVQPVDIAPGTMYNISRNEDIIIPSVGVLGEVALATNQNKTGTLTVSLKNTSPTNSVLSSFAFIGEKTDIKFFPVVLEDKSSNMALVTMGWIQSQPDFTLGTEVGQMDWVIGLVSSSISPIVVEAAEIAAYGA